MMLAASEGVANIDPKTVESATGIDEHLGEQLDLSLPFVDENGAATTLKAAALQNRPFILAPVYYSCPHLCTLTLNGLTELLKQLKLAIGTDFSVLAYTIKPEEGPDLALKKRANYLKELGDLPGKESWHFLTGPESSIEALSKQVGFKYVRDGEEYAHAAVLLVVTPDGKISKYLFGVMHDPEEARKALVDASEGRIGTIGERIFLYCFRYDHISGKYTPVIMNLVRVVGAVTVILLFGTLVLLRRRELLRFKGVGNLESA